MFTRPSKVRGHTLMWMMTGLDGKELATASVTSLHAGWPRRWQNLSAGEEDTFQLFHIKYDTNIWMGPRKGYSAQKIRGNLKKLQV